MSNKPIYWLCIKCGKTLGEVLGGELQVGVPEGHTKTRGANLVLTCDACGAQKTWYTADPIVRAIYQLTDAVATLAARRMVETAGKLLRE